MSDDTPMEKSAATPNDDGAGAVGIADSVGSTGRGRSIAGVQGDRGRRAGTVFSIACLLATWFGVLVLGVLLASVVLQAIPFLDSDFLFTPDNSRYPQKAGVITGLWGSFWLIVLTIAISVPIGVSAAMYLEEYARPTRVTRLIQINLSNLAGVPSIVYGILGLTAFKYMFNIFPYGSQIVTPLGSIPVPFGKSVLTGALTISLLILPVIIVAAQEALRAVPASIRHASIALGATRWQTTSRQVLPAALPGILTGIILAVSRAVGETAPLIMIGIPLATRQTPGGIKRISQVFTEPSRLLDVPFGDFTVLPYQIYGWATNSISEFVGVAAAAILVMLVVLLTLNSLAILIRNRFSRHAKW